MHVSEAVNLAQFLQRYVFHPNLDCGQSEQVQILLLLDIVGWDIRQPTSFEERAIPLSLARWVSPSPAAQSGWEEGRSAYLLLWSPNSTTVKQTCSNPVLVFTSNNIIVGWQHAVNSFARKRRGNKYLRCANCVNIAVWECASHLCSRG